MAQIPCHYSLKRVQARACALCGLGCERENAHISAFSPTSSHPRPDTAPRNTMPPPSMPQGAALRHRWPSLRAASLRLHLRCSECLAVRYASRPAGQHSNDGSQKAATSPMSMTSQTQRGHQILSGGPRWLTFSKILPQFVECLTHSDFVIFVTICSRKG